MIFTLRTLNSFVLYDLKVRLNYDPVKSGDDGVFWISWSDFVKAFNDIYVCRVFRLVSDTPPGQWSSYHAHGEWAGITAGGCNRYKDSSPHNPQFLLPLTRPCTVYVSLAQLRESRRQAQPAAVIIYDKGGKRIKEFTRGDLVSMHAHMREIHINICAHAQRAARKGCTS